MTKERSVVITKNTLIPLGLVFTAIGVASWLTTMYVDISYMKKKVDKIDEIAYDVAIIKAQVREDSSVGLTK